LNSELHFDSVASGLPAEKHLLKVFVAFDDAEAACHLVTSLSSDNPRNEVKSHIIMRQLKGKTKENAREKKERKKEFLENKEKAWTVAMPTLGVIFLFVILYVWLNSRPKVIVE